LLDRSILSLTLDYRRRACLARAGSRRGTLGGLRALNLRAAGTRARRALTTWLIALAAVKNYWLGLRNTALEHIVAEIRYRRALRLQHILA
jgi:hypothetical protein